jgi:predicted nucleic acid-binding protein
VALAFGEPLSPKAEVLFEAAGDASCVCCVPELFYVECAHAARKRALHSDLSVAEVKLCFRLLLEQPLQLQSMEFLASKVLDKSLSVSISSYDASYAVLAGELGVPVVSADLRLVRALRAAGESAIYLGDIDG